jgi:aryl-alcohol dehydrogenase (NADP+)
MQYQTLGGTGISVSRLCLGAMMFGAMGNRDHAECVSMIHRSLDAGINFIDTADTYSKGESETIVGRALADGRREDVILATKFYNQMGSDRNRRGGSRRWIVRAVEESLARLGTDYIDLYQMHRFDERTALEETMRALDDLVRSGKVRAIGSSMFPPDRIVEAQGLATNQGLARFRCEQPWYSIFSREIERFVLPACERYGMGAIVWSPLDGGWLAGRYRRPEDVAEGTRAHLTQSMVAAQYGSLDRVNQHKFELVDRLEEIATAAGLSLTHLALGFALEHPAVTSVIIGPRTPEQLDDLLAAADLRLSAETLDAIDALIPPGSNVNPAESGMVSLSALSPRRRRR